jgi:cell division septum initiation protein DivIVA
MRLFDSLVFPYREDESVDAVITLSINGGWRRESASAAAAGFVTGLTFGLAGTAMGPKMTGTHDAQAVLSKAASEAGRYSVQVTSTVEWGIAANTSEVSQKAEDLQRKRIAYELAKKIRADRRTLLLQMGK